MKGQIDKRRDLDEDEGAIRLRKVYKKFCGKFVWKENIFILGLTSVYGDLTLFEARRHWIRLWKIMFHVSLKISCYSLEILLTTTILITYFTKPSTLLRIYWRWINTNEKIFHPCYKRNAMCMKFFHYFDFARRQQKKLIFMEQNKNNIIRSSERKNSNYNTKSLASDIRRYSSSLFLQDSCSIIPFKFSSNVCHRTVSIQTTTLYKRRFSSVTFWGLSWCRRGSRVLSALWRNI